METTLVQPIMLLWDALDTNNFYFILFYFYDFILILFFSFFFFFWTMKKVRDTAVT